MKTKINFIFMSILVVGLIGNSIIISELAFADKPDKEQKETAKAQDKAAKAQDKAANAQDKAANAQDKAANAQDKAAKAQDKNDNKDIQEFENGVVLTTSNTTTICHVPPGNPGNAHTITIGKPAVRAHFANHNDFSGPCNPDDLKDLEDNEDEKELRLAEGLTQKQSNALDRALKLIEQLEQKISNLEERMQNLLNMYESGEYYGNITTADSITNSYGISFDGMAASIYDESETTEMSGELFMENQVTTSDTSKFKIHSGEVIIGNNIYDVVFGKARASSSGSSDSMVIVLQTVDSEENNNTIKITLGFTSAPKGEFGNPPEEFEILDNSKVSGQWTLEGSGTLSLET